VKKKDKKTLICLVGPTASGKTDVALELAKRINAEVISCDSMQVYTGIDIATSKPTKKQRKAIPHHLLDILRPSRQYSAARFRNSSRKIIKDIHSRGKVPLIVAGTGLYLRALLDGLFTGPAQTLSLRRKFYQQARAYGASYLYRRLKNKDPKSAERIHPHDLRRVIRALEVYETAGIPISKLQEKTRGIRDEYNLHIFGLQRARPELYTRIEHRVDRMFRRGLVAEIKRLNSCRLSKTAKALLGYKEITGFLNGEYSQDDARALLKRNTKRYAKRQLSWFKREKGVKWVELDNDDNLAVAAEQILSLIAKD
jgi:tRNA dimethylallyltransferase